MPRLSVIVPVYKVAEYLDQCVESILNQTFQDFECILVDDGSPDGCPAICDAWAQRDARIRVIHKPNEGVVTARLTGTEQAAGEYVSFVDGDDFLDPSMLERMMVCVDETGADYVGCGSVLFWPDKTLPEPGVNMIADADTIRKSIIPAYIGTNHNDCVIRGFVWGSVCRRALAHKSICKIPPTMKIREDRLQVLHILANCNKLALMEDCLYFYRQRASSASNAPATSGEDCSERFWMQMKEAAEGYGYTLDVAPLLEKELVLSVGRVFYSNTSIARKCAEIKHLVSQMRDRRNLLRLTGSTVGEKAVYFAVYLGMYPLLLVIQAAKRKVL